MKTIAEIRKKLEGRVRGWADSIKENDEKIYLELPHIFLYPDFVNETKDALEKIFGPFEDKTKIVHATITFDVWDRCLEPWEEWVYTEYCPMEQDVVGGARIGIISETLKALGFRAVNVMVRREHKQTNRNQERYKKFKESQADAMSMFGLLFLGAFIDGKNYNPRKDPNPFRKT